MNVPKIRKPYALKRLSKLSKVTSIENWMEAGKSMTLERAEKKAIELAAEFDSSRIYFGNNPIIEFNRVGYNVTRRVLRNGV